MKDKEKLFCSYYASTLNKKEAALKSGYRINPEKSALKLLERDEINKHIKSLLKGRGDNIFALTVSGLEKLAFGGVADALKLIFADRENMSAEFIDGLDLFNVSEIKFQKTGGIEVKFFDRLKALAELAQMSNDDVIDSAVPFYKALEKSAMAIKDIGKYD